MTLTVSLPASGGPQADVWPVLFELADDLPRGWAVVGAQMVIIHAAAHHIARPLRTRDVDILVNLQAVRPQQIAQWLQNRGFHLASIDTDGVGHQFRRKHLSVDVLGTDHAGPRADTTTVPPARTVQVPGGRRAMNRLTSAAITMGSTSGAVPIPDWVGALVLKARAALEVDGREKHLRDLALLLALPVDAFTFAAGMSGSERAQLQRAVDLLDDGVWRSLGARVDPRAGRAAARLVGNRPDTR